MSVRSKLAAVAEVMATGGGSLLVEKRPRPTEGDYREALYAAQRALLHAVRLDGPSDVHDLFGAALATVNRVLDIGRDESSEQVAT